MTPEQEKRIIPCPECGAPLLMSEDRGAHCDGCDHDPQEYVMGYAAAIEREVPRWRPIGEAPQHGAVCTVVINGVVQHCPLQWVGDGWEFPAGVGDLVGGMSFEDVCGKDIGITHWQPLPEPPKEGE